MKKGIICFTTLALLLGSSYSFAQVYLGASVGQTDYGFSSDSGTSFGGSIGYKFNEYFALEGGYTDYGNTDFRYFLGVDQTASISAFNVSAIAMIPISEKFNIYGRVGVHNWDSSANVGTVDLGSEDGTDIGYGAGVNFKFTDSFGVFAEYRSISTGGDNTNNISAGIKFSFGE